jgi:hypothetical protein
MPVFNGQEIYSSSLQTNTIALYFDAAQLASLRVLLGLKTGVQPDNIQAILTESEKHERLQHELDLLNVITAFIESAQLQTDQDNFIETVEKIINNNQLSQRLPKACATFVATIKQARINDVRTTAYEMLAENSILSSAWWSALGTIIGSYFNSASEPSIKDKEINDTPYSRPNAIQPIAKINSLPDNNLLEEIPLTVPEHPDHRISYVPVASNTEEKRLIKELVKPKPEQASTPEQLSPKPAVNPSLERQQRKQVFLTALQDAVTKTKTAKEDRSNTEKLTAAHHAKIYAIQLGKAAGITHDAKGNSIEHYIDEASNVNLVEQKPSISQPKKTTIAPAAPIKGKHKPSKPVAEESHEQRENNAYQAIFNAIKAIQVANANPDKNELKLIATFAEIDACALGTSVGMQEQHIKALITMGVNNTSDSPAKVLLSSDIYIKDKNQGPPSGLRPENDNITNKRSSSASS